MDNAKNKSLKCLVQDKNDIKEDRRINSSFKNTYKVSTLVRTAQKSFLGN